MGKDGPPTEQPGWGSFFWEPMSHGCPGWESNPGPQRPEADKLPRNYRVTLQSVQIRRVFALMQHGRRRVQFFQRWRTDPQSRVVRRWGRRIPLVAPTRESV